jgi:hypothetical protein
MPRNLPDLRTVSETERKTITEAIEALNDNINKNWDGSRRCLPLTVFAIAMEPVSGTFRLKGKTVAIFKVVVTRAFTPSCKASAWISSSACMRDLYNKGTGYYKVNPLTLLSSDKIILYTILAL